MAQFDVIDMLQGGSVVHRERMPLAAAVDLLALGMDQRHGLAVRQRDFRVALARAVVYLPEIVPNEISFVQIGRSADSLDRVPVLDERLRFYDLKPWTRL